MTEILESTIARNRPIAPSTLAETGLSSELVTDLVVKTQHRTTELSGR